MHILAAEGCFGGDGFFHVPSISVYTTSLEKLFVHGIFKMLLPERLTKRIIELISYWRHPGFSTYFEKRIYPKLIQVES